MSRKLRQENNFKKKGGGCSEQEEINKGLIAYERYNIKRRQGHADPFSFFSASGIFTKEHDLQKLGRQTLIKWS